MLATTQIRRIVPGFVSANNPFSGYKREDAQPVRHLDVTGQSYQEQVKKAREMLRSMTPEQVKQVIEFHRNLNLLEALTLAQREGKFIVPNDVHDRILTETKDEKYIRENYPVRTGTFIIYEAPDKKFGEQVIFEGITFNVPEQFIGKTNCALVVEHPDFDLIDLGDSKYEIRVSDKHIHQIERFSKEEGWHLTEYGIPVGAEVASSKNDARYLYRINKTHIGSVVRDDFDDRYRRYVVADNDWSDRLKVALMPLVGTPEKSDLHE